MAQEKNANEPNQDQVITYAHSANYDFFILALSIFSFAAAALLLIGPEPAAPGMSPGRVISYLWNLKGEALAAVGHTEEARSLLIAATESAQASEERFLLWRLHASLARCYCAMRCLEAAEKEYSTAKAHIDELAATVPDEKLKDRFRQCAYGILGTPP